MRESVQHPRPGWVGPPVISAARDVDGGGGGVPEASVDIVDDTFVVAPREQVAKRLADPVRWRAWWPDLWLHVTLDRGPDGIAWSVSGALEGTAEIWLEPWQDGVIVHWFLRAQPHERTDPARLRDAYATDYKRHITELKDELEHGRPAGIPRGRRRPVVSASAPTTGATMAEQTTSSIVIAAPPAEVMAVIADLEAYPEWTASVREVEVLTVYEDDERPAEARFVLDAGAIKDTYTLSYEWDDDREVRWTLVKAGLLRALDGSYMLRESADGSTDVTYQLRVDVAIPMLGLMKRKAEKVIIDTALKELKKRVEG
jgi:ribosome-associated toxin RatA of RatAB toxin-antitoxin module